MARERPSSPRARLFVALEPAERDELVRWRDRLVTGRDDLRPVAPEALHVTLVFLGWRYEREVPQVAELCRAAADRSPSARLVPQGVRPLPPRGWPRLFALDLEDVGGHAGALQGRLAGSLEAARLYRPEKRPFWPHVTLARVKRERRAAPVEPRDLPPPLEADRVTLYRSTLRPQGAVYEPLAAVGLAGRG